MLALALPLGLFILVEFALDAVCGAMEQIDGRPQQFLEVRFEPCGAQRRDQGVEDVGDRNGDYLALGKRPRVGLVAEWSVAEELQFAKDVVSRG